MDNGGLCQSYAVEHHALHIHIAGRLIFRNHGEGFATSQPKDAEAVIYTRSNVIIRLCSINSCFSHPQEICGGSRRGGLLEDNVFNRFEGGSNSNGEFAELRVYLMAKLLWNPKANAEHIIDEFIAAYCGKAAPMIREYLDARTRKGIDTIHQSAFGRPEQWLYHRGALQHLCLAAPPLRLGRHGGLDRLHRRCASDSPGPERV